MRSASSLRCSVVYVAYKWWERRAFYAALRMARIGVDELYRLMDEGANPVVVDVRTTTARTVEPRQIPGSLHVPLEALDLHVGKLPRDRDIVLYCTCPNEASAAQVAKLLMDRGYRRVRPLYGGLDAWIAAGYGIEPLAASAPDARFKGQSGPFDGFVAESPRRGCQY